MKKYGTILLIDDDKIANYLNKRLLDNLNAAEEIKVVYNGKEAIKCLTSDCLQTKKSPDVIFLDINMPVMDGFEFLNKFQSMKFENKENVLIGVLTTSSHPVDKVKMKELGANSFLNKPLNKEMLVEFLKLDDVQ